MHDSASTWDLRSIPHESTSAERALVFFFLIAVAVAAANLIRIWRMAPPFLVSRQAGNQSFLRQLRQSTRSTSQWMELTLLFYCLLIRFDLYHECSALLAPGRILAIDVVYLLQNVLVLLEMGLLLMLLLFLVRWHFFSRIESVKSGFD